MSRDEEAEPPEAGKAQVEDGVTVTYGQGRRKKTKVRGFSFYTGDDELVDYIAGYLGTSRSEAVRSAVRAYASHLAYISGSRQRG